MSKALVLSLEAVPGVEAVTFPGFPGVWPPGQAIEVDAFVREGVFEDAGEMLAAAKDLGLPLEEVSVAADSAPLPERDNHIPSPEQAVAAAEKALAEMTHAELDAKATSLGIDLPDGTKPEKVEALEAAMGTEAVEELGVDELTEDES